MGQDLKRNLFFEGMHLQWFAEGDAAAAGAGGEAGEPEGGEPAGSGEPGPLTAAPWLSQASDKYKRDEHFLADLLKGPKAVKSWSEVLDRMYDSEREAGEHQAAATDLQAKLSAEQARAAELEKGGQPAAYKPEDYAKVAPGKLPAFMQEPDFVAYSKELSVYLADATEEIKKVAHELQLPVSAAQRFADLFVARHVAAFETGQREYARQREVGLKALKEAWKGDFEARQEVARRAIATFGGMQLVKLLALRGLENDAVVVHAFEKIGSSIGEGHLVPGRAGPSPEGAVSGSGEKARPDLKKRYGRSPELFGTGGR